MNNVIVVDKREHLVAELERSFARGRSDRRRRRGALDPPYRDSDRNAAWSRGYEFEELIERLTR